MRGLAVRRVLLAVGTAASSALLGACAYSKVPTAMTITDLCIVTYPDGSQSDQEDCDMAVSDAAAKPGSYVQQLVEYPGGDEEWVRR